MKIHSILTSLVLGFACAYAEPSISPTAEEKPQADEAAPQTIPTPSPPRPLGPVANQGLAWLAKTQNADGGWGQGGGWRTNISGKQGGRVVGDNVADPSDIGNTSIVLQCFLRSGAKLENGDYSAVTTRAADFLLREIAKADADSLYVTSVRDTQLQSKIGLYVDTFLAAGTHEDTIELAIPFLRTCQNHNSGDPDFDDGGFFQMPLDPTRNKAGQAGADSNRQMRFVSYAAATADGLRCLLFMPTAEDSQRIAAARDWLKAFKWSAAGSSSSPRDLVYYAARSISATAVLDLGLSCLLPSIRSQLNESRLIDGSWQNPAGEMRENCPLVAISLALEALRFVERTPCFTR